MVVGRWPRPWADAQFGAAVRRTTSDLRFLEERIALALLTNRSERTVTRNHDSFIRQGENFFMQRGNNLLERTTRKVGTSNASREERVPGNQFLLLGKIEANAAVRMPRRMHHLRDQRPLALCRVRQCCDRYPLPREQPFRSTLLAHPAFLAALN